MGKKRKRLFSFLLVLLLLLFVVSVVLRLWIFFTVDLVGGDGAGDSFPSLSISLLYNNPPLFTNRNNYIEKEQQQTKQQQRFESNSTF